MVSNEIDNADLCLVVHGMLPSASYPCLRKMNRNISSVAVLLGDSCVVIRPGTVQCSTGALLSTALCLSRTICFSLGKAVKFFKAVAHFAFQHRNQELYMELTGSGFETKHCNKTRDFFLLAQKVWMGWKSKEGGKPK